VNLGESPTTQVDLPTVQREVDKVSLGATLCEAVGDSSEDVRILITDPSDASVLAGDLGFQLRV